MMIGYARVSTEDQNLDLQHDALAKAGAERVFQDKASGARDDRPGLADALSHVRKGDCLIVWRLDRLGRSMRSLIGFVEELRERGIDFRSVTEGIDTTTAAGRFFFHVLAALAQMERELSGSAPTQGSPRRVHVGARAADSRSSMPSKSPMPASCWRIPTPRSRTWPRALASTGRRSIVRWGSAPPGSGHSRVDRRHAGTIGTGGGGAAFFVCERGIGQPGARPVKAAITCSLAFRTVSGSTGHFDG